MAKSVFGGAHHHLVDALRSARERSGMRQADVAAKLGKDQSFISIIENSQRRIDVLEFIALCRAIGVRPEDVFAEVVSNIPGEIKI